MLHQYREARLQRQIGLVDVEAEHADASTLLLANQQQRRFGPAQAASANARLSDWSRRASSVCAAAGRSSHCASAAPPGSIDSNRASKRVPSTRSTSVADLGWVP